MKFHMENPFGGFLTIRIIDASFVSRYLSCRTSTHSCDRLAYMSHTSFSPRALLTKCHFLMPTTPYFFVFHSESHVMRGILSSSFAPFHKNLHLRFSIYFRTFMGIFKQLIEKTGMVEIIDLRSIILLANVSHLLF